MDDPKVNMAGVHEAYANATTRYLQALAARREYEETPVGNNYVQLTAMREANHASADDVPVLLACIDVLRNEADILRKDLRAAEFREQTAAMEARRLTEHL